MTDAFKLKLKNNIDRIIEAILLGKELNPPTLQSIINVKLSKHGFWHCQENRLIKTIQTIPHNLYVSVKSASLYWGLG